MATVLTEHHWPAEFLLSEAPGSLSRENVVLLPNAALSSGSVLGKVTASGKYTHYDTDAGDGTEIAAGILLAETVASEVEQGVAIIDTLAEVSAALLVWKSGLDDADKAAGLVDLRARFIKAR